MSGFSKRSDPGDRPALLMWGARFGLSLLTLLTLAVITAILASAVRVSFWTVAMHVTLATCGACFLWLLYLLHVTQPSEVRQRQFSMRLALVAMCGLAMMLAGIGGIFRLAHFDPSQTTWRDWLGLVIAFASVFLIGTPLLTVVLETVVALANAVIRWPVARRFFRRALRREEGSSEA